MSTHKHRSTKYIWYSSLDITITIFKNGCAKTCTNHQSTPSCLGHEGYPPTQIQHYSYHAKSPPNPMKVWWPWLRRDGCYSLEFEQKIHFMGYNWATLQGASAPTISELMARWRSGSDLLLTILRFWGRGSVGLLVLVLDWTATIEESKVAVQGMALLTRVLVVFFGELKGLLRLLRSSTCVVPGLSKVLESSYK